MITQVPSLLMTVGRKYYKLYQYVDEAQNIGVSKRIPITAIPDGLVKGLSKIFLAHPDAIVKVTASDKTFADLAYALYEKDYLTAVQYQKIIEDVPAYWTGEELHPNDLVPERMLDVTYALSKVPGPEHMGLGETFGLEFCMGIFGYSYYSGIEYVCKPGEDELPAELAHLDGYVEPVHIMYNNDSEAPYEEEDEGE